MKDRRFDILENQVNRIRHRVVVGQEDLKRCANHPVDFSNRVDADWSNKWPDSPEKALNQHKTSICVRFANVGGKRCSHH